MIIHQEIPLAQTEEEEIGLAVLGRREVVEGGRGEVVEGGRGEVVEHTVEHLEGEDWVSGQEGRAGEQEGKGEEQEGRAGEQERRSEELEGRRAGLRLDLTATVGLVAKKGDRGGAGDRHRTPAVGGWVWWWWWWYCCGVFLWWLWCQ